MRLLRRVLGNEILLGSLVAVLSVLTALVGYQGSMADSKQNENEISAMKNLNDGNAAYLEANQFIVYDYSMFDGWYTTEDQEKAAYYESSYSEELQDAIAAAPEDPFGEDYYDAMYTEANDYWAESDVGFELAADYDKRGDNLQLVVLLLALGLAFAAWAALMRDESHLRGVFSAFSIIMLAVGLAFYIPIVTNGVGA